MKFNDLLSLNVACELVAGKNACVLVIGEHAPALADQLAAASTTVGLWREHGPQRVLFGLPVLTLPYPILVHSVMTEHNTPLDQLSLFGWIEDNAILEPRAEIFGLTPLAADPVLFIRDLDLDRPPECYIQSGPAFKGSAWLRVAGVVIARGEERAANIMATGDDGALSALELILPPSLQPFIARIRAEVVAGRELRQVLRARRRGTDPAIMAICDGWRVLARAARFVVVGAEQPTAEQSERLFRVDATRKW
jgi:hypothetical protein